MREPKALATKGNTTPIWGVVVNVLSFRLRDWGGIALCTFGIRVEHGILQNAIRFQSVVRSALPESVTPSVEGVSLRFLKTSLSLFS